MLRSLTRIFEAVLEETETLEEAKPWNFDRKLAKDFKAYWKTVGGDGFMAAIEFVQYNHCDVSPGQLVAMAKAL
jgi:hypothetical protein